MTGGAVSLSLLQIVASLVTMAALFSYLNHRYLRLPATIGLMVISLLCSLVVVAAGHYRPEILGHATGILSRIDFGRTLLEGMLGYLLFAGALHVDLARLRREGLVIGLLATVGVLLSTAIVGGMSWVALRWVGLPVSFMHCLLFGALISPTDPISVLAILKSLGAPPELEVQIAGESLFNDGVGVVVFSTLLGIAAVGPLSPAQAVGQAAILFLREAVGGALFGLGCGYLVYRMLKNVDDYQVEILITLALVTGGFTLARVLHVSGPIAMVVAGLIIGNHGRAFAMSEHTRRHVDSFWELVDSLLNAVLFVLIGLVVLLLALSWRLVLAGVGAVGIVLIARFLSVGLPLAVLRRRAALSPNALEILVWGGLRGGISVALALYLRNALGPSLRETSDVILTMTYVVVAFSLLVQGLTAPAVVRRLLKAAQ